jgi:uncharacterized protein with ATP-grasp and redox domains
MKTLEPIPQCIDCLASLSKDVVALTASADPGLASKVEDITARILAEAGNNHSTSPQIANRIFNEIRKITGIDDPYKEFKAREMAHAREIFLHLEDQVADTMRSRAILAALGNSLDFFKNPEQTLIEIPDQFNKGISFYYDGLDKFEAYLSKGPQRILYLTDNAGEIYFDGPLYDYLKGYCRQISLVVKGGPSLNDLTRVELLSAGLHDRFGSVADTGVSGVGIDWERVSEEFLELLNSADLIVSKGMANFETLYPKQVPAPSLYLFKVKCKPIQNYILAPENSFSALWKQGVSM